MTVARAAVLIAWSVFVLLVVGWLMFLYTFGDCGSETACRTYKNGASSVIIGSGFVVYWAVFIVLIRRWSRK
jgi:hypothetical protein